MCATRANLGTPYIYRTAKYIAGNGDTYHQSDIDTRAQRNYAFLEILWGDNDDRRKMLLGIADESQRALKENLVGPPLKLKLPDDVDFAVIDLETGTMVIPPDTQGKHFYMLMLPANPSDNSHKTSQQWTEAWYHAVRETGGM